MKKNKARAHQKKVQRKEAEKKARRKISAMTRDLMTNLRKQGVYIPMQRGPDRDLHEAGDTISIPKCGGIGECCANVIVNLDTADIWRILNNEKVRQRFGVDVTMDLVSTEPDKGLVEYWVDPRIGVPRCKLRHVKKEQGRIECLFLEFEDGKPTCILGSDRPTICVSNPIGRVGRKDASGKLTGWGFILRDAPCAKCAFKEENHDIQISEYLKDHDMEVRFGFLDLFYGFQGWIANNVKVEEMRKLAAMISFDWDRFLIEIGGHSRDEVKSVRPENPESVLASARLIVDGIMRGQTDVVQSQGAGKAEEDGVVSERQAVPPDADR